MYFTAYFPILLYVSLKCALISYINGLLHDNVPHANSKLASLDEPLIISAISFKVAIGNHLPQSQQTFLAIAYNFSDIFVEVLWCVQSLQPAGIHNNVVAIVIERMLNNCETTDFLQIITLLYVSF